MAKRRREQPVTRNINKRDVTDFINQYLTNHPTERLDYRRLAALMGVKDGGTRRLLGAVLAEMADRGRLQSVAHGVYKNARQSEEFECKATGLRTGAVIVTLPDGTETQIPQELACHALDGDTVRVRHRQSSQPGVGDTEILAVLSRARDTYVGVVQVRERFAFLVPDGNRMPYDIYLPIDELHGASNGVKAQVRITHWPTSADHPFGKVIEVIGKPGEHETEMHAILAEFDLPYRYPEAVTKAAKALKPGITKSEVASRRDFRGTMTFTIDPDTAKDFDDALSLQVLADGNYEVGVHIADVTHYVTPESLIEAEAYQRATSVYLVDRTVPMLPERLCNEICSLRPDEDKLCYSVVFTLTPDARVVESWIGRTVIRSIARLTYGQAQQVIETQQGELRQEILCLNRLASILRDRRFANGAIDFTSDEVRFQLDPDGVPIGVEPEESNESHWLIEEFMLLANRTVAEFVGKPRPGYKPHPCVYRVHEKPNPEKLESFCQMAARFGHTYKGSIDRITGKDITSLVHSAKGKPEQHMIDILAVRAMAKAKYSTHNIGHYGLAFDYYTHFTSPIRRYPDMMVHRLLALLQSNKPFPAVDDLEERCVHSSEMEKIAADAERASVKYKQVEYMGARIGQEFNGIISGVMEFGFFVEIEENKCEGLVATRDLTDDYYTYDPEAFSLTGRQNKRQFCLGDAVRIQVLRADTQNRRLDFLVTEHKGESLSIKPAPESGSRHTGRRTSSSRMPQRHSKDRAHTKASRGNRRRNRR